MILGTKIFFNYLRLMRTNHGLFFQRESRESLEEAVPCTVLKKKGHFFLLSLDILHEAIMVRRIEHTIKQPETAYTYREDPCT